MATARSTISSRRSVLRSFDDTLAWPLADEDAQP